MKKQYIVRLSEQECRTCLEVIKKRKGPSQKVRRAQMLLKADADGPTWTDAKIAKAFACRMQTVENLRKRLVTAGFALALNGKKREEPPTPPRLHCVYKMSTSLIDTLIHINQLLKAF